VVGFSKSVCPIVTELGTEIVLVHIGMTVYHGSNFTTDVFTSTKGVMSSSASVNLFVSRIIRKLLD